MRILYACTFLVALGGCMAPRIDASRYAVDYNRTIAIEANETTLLNIVRSSYGDTRHFTSINGITAEFTAQRSAEVGLTTGGETFAQTLSEVIAAAPTGTTNTTTDQTVDGRRTLGGSAGFSLSYAQQPTFAIGVSNTPEFARGTGSPIDRTILTSLLSEGYPSSIILAVLVDEVVVEGPGDGNTQMVLRIDNPMAAPSDTAYCGGELYRLLQDNLEYSVGGAVRPETLAIVPANAETIDQIDSLLAAGYGIRSGKGAQGGQGGLELYRQPSTPGYTLQSNLPEESILRTRLADCLRNAGVARPAGDAQGPEETAVADGKVTVRLVMRSPQGAINALGEYLRVVSSCFVAGQPARDDCDGRIFIRRGAGDQGEDLLRIERAPTYANPGYSPAHTTYSGYRWIVPQGTPEGERGHRTMQVFQLIQTLINLNRSADELRTPAFIQLD